MSHIGHGGDDIEDGLDYAISSSDEQHGSVSGDESPEAVQKAPVSKKRKSGGSKLHDKKRLKMEMDMAQKRDLAKETDTAVIADYINKRIAQRNPDLSALELAELYFNKNEIRLTADSCGDDRSLDSLPRFIKQKFINMLPGKAKKSSGKGETNAAERKFIAIVSMSAIRACDVYRSTRPLDGLSLKLINKNKIEVDLGLVASTQSRVLCCTPGRLLKVLDSENLELKRLEIKIVIVDNSYLDSKCQNIWDIKETFGVLKDLTKSGSKLYLF